MVDVRVVLYPVSFVLESEAARVVALTDATDGSPPARRLRGAPDEAARSLLDSTVDRLLTHTVLDAGEDTRALLKDLLSRTLTLAGVHTNADAIELVYSSVIPAPLAEDGLDVAAGSAYHWRVLNQSQHRRKNGIGPRKIAGAEAVLLDHWRQAFEETDAALDFLPEYLTLSQLRSLYDAMWGYDQDPSGFKRWAVDRSGAFSSLLNEVLEDAEVDAAFYRALGVQLPPESAAEAGALTRADLLTTGRAPVRAAIGVAAATAGIRLFPKPGPGPRWYRKSNSWLAGPTWIENVYPPRPDWTSWQLGPA